MQPPQEGTTAQEAPWFVIDAKRATAPFDLAELWYYRATPVVYPSSLVPVAWRPLLALNPMAGVIEAYRAATLGLPLDWSTLGVSVLSGLALAAPGVWQFRRMERRFADVV